MEGALEENCGQFYEEEAAIEDAKAAIERIVKVEEEKAWIETMPSAELPKYVNHSWFYPPHEKLFLERLKGEELPKNLTPA